MSDKKQKSVKGHIVGDLIMGLPAKIVTEAGTLHTSPVEHFIVNPVNTVVITENTRYLVWPD